MPPRCLTSFPWAWPAHAACLASSLACGGHSTGCESGIDCSTVPVSTNPVQGRPTAGQGPVYVGDSSGPAAGPCELPDPPPAPGSSGQCLVARSVSTALTGACSESWCGEPRFPTLVTCDPVQMSFAGGYHYVLEGEGYVADFMFAPVNVGPDPSVAEREELGWMHLTFVVGETAEGGVPITWDAFLDSEDAFRAGLDVVDGTIVGTLSARILAQHAEGPLYHASCQPSVGSSPDAGPGDAGSAGDAPGAPAPDACPCAFEASSPALALHIPLGPLR